MTTSNIDAKELAEVARVAEVAARASADHVLTGYRGRVGIEHKKSRSDLVTRFDRESEELLKKALAPLGIAVVGEEGGGTAAARTFYVDPLDGTTNFAHGHPFFCVSVGLVENGVPIFGVVVAPALNLVWTGGRDHPAMRAGKACRVSEIAELEDSLLATGFPYDRRTNPNNNFDAFVAIKQKAQAIRRCGAAAIDLCLVADGTYEGYWERKLQSWDVAGGGAILVAAGGKTSSFDGSPLDVTRGHIVASNGRVHEALLGELAKLPSTQATLDAPRP